MKNASKHAETLKTLFKSLSKQHDVIERPKYDPFRAVAISALSEDMPDARVTAALVVLDREFVDLNELRVATELEVGELVGDDFDEIVERAAIIRQVLHGIFDKEHAMKLDRVAQLKSKEIRQYFRDLPNITPYVEGYVMQTSFGIPAVPIDQTMVDLLIDEEVLEEGTSLEDAQKFVEAHLKADDMWPFFCVVRATAIKKGSRAKNKKKV